MTVNRLVGALLLALGLVLAACSAGSTATQVGRVPGASVVVGTTGVPASLDFTTTGGAAIPQALMANVYEGLVRIDPAGQVAPHLAESWEVSPDRTRYTFRLREGVRFSNGDPFTAESAKFSIEYVRDEWTNALRSQMDVVERVEVLDARVLQVDLHRPSNNWLWSMGTLTGAMMTPSGIPTLATAPVGTGPYVLDRFAVGESISFHVRGDYWGTPARHDAAIRYFSDAVSAVNALRSGDIDVVWSMQSPELLDTLPGEYGVAVGTTNGEVLLSMNNNRAPFDDPRVRRAVAHAVDRHALNEVVWEGLATDTGGSPVPPTDPWFTGHDHYPHDQGRARELLAEAGAEGASVRITVPGLPYAQNISELLYSQLREVGLDVELATVEFPAVWLAQVMGAQDYDMSVIAHVEPRDLPVLFGDPGGYLGFDDAGVRAALLAADTGEDQVGNMRSAVDGIMAEAGALTLFNLPNIVLTAPGVGDVEPTVVTDALPLAGMGRT